jgi:hypothetical protein
MHYYRWTGSRCTSVVGHLGLAGDEGWSRLLCNGIELVFVDLVWVLDEVYVVWVSLSLLRVCVLGMGLG